MVDTLKDVGTRSERDPKGETGGFDTPSLWGVGQTGPWLHDGSAATLEEVLANPRHLFAGLDGEAVEVSPEQLADLVAFLKTISSETPEVP